MNDSDALADFRVHGRAAGFLLGCGLGPSVEAGQRRQRKAVAIYNTHPHMQEKFHDIATGFTWNLDELLTAEQGAELC